MKYSAFSLVLLALAGCGSNNSPSVQTGSGTSSQFALQTWPIQIGAPFPANITMNAFINGQIRQIAVDTGSVYAFLGDNFDDSVTSYQIPLTSPLTLNYGYTSKIESVQFYTYANQQTQATLVSSIVRGSNGQIYYQNAQGTQTAIASELLSFYDTDTTVPFVMINGDISLMGNQVGKALISGSDDVVRADKVVVNFLDVNGNPIQLTQDLSAYNNWMVKTNGSPAYIPEAADFSNITNLVMLLGLNFIGNYDFQFAIDTQQQATSVTLPSTRDKS